MSYPTILTHGARHHEAIDEERHRQEVLKAAGRFKFTCADVEMTNLERYAVLMEEIGEVARVLVESSGLANDIHGKGLRKELVQCGAVIIAWLEGLDADQEMIDRARARGR
jgi:hypothetical protein